MPCLKLRRLFGVAVLLGGSVGLTAAAIVCSVVLIARIVCGVTVFMYVSLELNG